MKILITGGLGFIGAHLVNAFKDKHEITILDKYDKTYPGYAKIYRGPTKGVVSTNAIEDYHRDLNLKYRMKFIKDIKVIRNWSFKKLPYEKYDLILNCGGLCEAILSHHYPRFCKQSIVKGTENLKKSMQGYQGKSMQMLEKAFDPDGLTAVNKELDEYPFYVRLILQKVLEKYGGSLANVPLPTGTDMVETGGQLGKLGIDSP